MEKKIEKYDVAIIGGGAAGLTAGIYCGRARLKTILFEKALVGGLATYTNEIVNYPGFPEGQTGLGLMELFHKQAKSFGVDFKLTDVKSVELEEDTKIVETFRIRYEVKVVIIASGGRPRVTGAPREEEFLFDKGISFCATCDAAANTGKTVLVIGSGDAAIEEGMFLTKFASKVIVSVMHDEGIMDCNEIAKAEALENPKMEFIWNTVVDHFDGKERLEHVVLKNLKTKETIPVKVDTCFEFIGYLPNTEIFKGKVNMTKNGYILVNEKMETNIDGVFSAGDVNAKWLKQVATAVGDGAIAGYAAERYISEQNTFYNQILNINVPNIVYVFDASSAECRELLPIMEELEQRAEGKYKVTKVDVYKSTGIASRLGSSACPSIVTIKDKKVDKILVEDITISNILDLI